MTIVEVLDFVGLGNTYYIVCGTARWKIIWYPIWASVLLLSIGGMYFTWIGLAAVQALEDRGVKLTWQSTSILFVSIREIPSDVPIDLIDRFNVARNNYKTFGTLSIIVIFIVSSAVYILSKVLDSACW